MNNDEKIIELLTEIRDNLRTESKLREESIQLARASVARQRRILPLAVGMFVLVIIFMAWAVFR